MNWLDNLPANSEHHNENPAWNPVNAPVHVPEPWRRKRFRTIFTPYQLAWLEREFRLRPYLDRIRRSQLAEQLKLTERQIKVWFQNRRTKLKKENLENFQPTPAEQIMETPTNMAQENRYYPMQHNFNNDSYQYFSPQNTQPTQPPSCMYANTWNLSFWSL